MYEILKLCYEADINIQNINYSILKENYIALREGEENDKPAKESRIKKFMTMVKGFFEKVVNAMQRMAVRLASFIKPFREYASSLKIETDIVDDISIYNYTLMDVLKWADKEFENTKTYYYDRHTKTFEEYHGRIEKNATSNTFKIIKEISSYKSAVDFVKKGYKAILGFINSDSDQEDAKYAFNIYKEAIKLIQQHVNACTKYLITLYKRAVKYAATGKGANEYDFFEDPDFEEAVEIFEDDKEV